MSLAGYVATLVLLPVLVIVGSMATGWWSTTGRRLPAAQSDTAAVAGSGSAAPAGSVESAVPAVPADVRVSMTVAQVVAAFPAGDGGGRRGRFRSPAGTPSSTQLKTLVKAGGAMELPAFRTWLEQHLSS